MEYADERWMNFNKRLSDISTDTINFVNKPVFHEFVVSPMDRNTAVCKREIKLIKKYIKGRSFKTILEVGGGTVTLLAISWGNFRLTNIPYWIHLQC